MTATTHLDARTPIMTLRSLETPLPEEFLVSIYRARPQEAAMSTLKNYCILFYFEGGRNVTISFDRLHSFLWP